jgi:hypothetical protein
MLNFTENFPRYDKRFTEDLWAVLRAEFHSRCYNKLKLENKIKFENSKSCKNLTKANTAHGQNTRENNFWH